MRWDDKSLAEENRNQEMPERITLVIPHPYHHQLIHHSNRAVERQSVGAGSRIQALCKTWDCSIRSILEEASGNKRLSGDTRPCRTNCPFQIDEYLMP